MAAKKKNKNLADELVDELLSEDSEGELELKNQDEAPVEDASTLVIDINTKTRQAMEPSASVDPDLTGRFYAGAASPLQNALAQTQSLTVAQEKILELEEEINKLRLDNEELAAAGEVFKNKSDEFFKKLEDSEARYKEDLQIFAEEKEILLQSIKDRGAKMDAVVAEKAQLESRIQKNINRVRVRERELENRLELIKMENVALARTKDEIILDLKKQIDKLMTDLTDHRDKNGQLNNKIESQHEILRRTVKALRLALSMLEGEGVDPNSKAS